jgi:type VI secretion system protein ImpF
MADLFGERIQPCLLDRLTDENPDAVKESRNERVISVKRYREGVLRDLIWLLNAKAHTAEDGLDEFPEAARSVLNFGTRDLCGLISSSLDLGTLEREIAEAMRRLEPRINPGSLAVTAVSGSQKFANGIAIEIRGDLWAYPVPEQLYIRTEIDLDTGKYIV